MAETKNKYKYMGTDFSKKPITNTSASEKTEKTTEVAFPVIKTSEADQGKLVKDDSMIQENESPILDIQPDFLVKQIQDVLRSPSPFVLFKKSAELKENFAAFINYIVKKISAGFSSQDKTVILSMYQNARYEQIWIANLKNYLDDSKYFDVNLYFKTITILKKDSQYLAKGLMKLYKNESKDSISAFLKKYRSGYSIDEIISNYKYLQIDDLEKDVDPKYLDENNISRFLEQLYLLSMDSGRVLQLFSFEQEEMRGKFDEVYKLFSFIAKNYLKQVSYKDRQVLIYLGYSKNREIIQKMDEIIDNYLQDKENFYKKITKVISEKNPIERGYFWSYAKTRIIDLYYKEVSRLFYWDSHACSNRNEWAALKGNFVFSDKSQHPNEILEVLSFKRLILELNNNIFAPFLKPFVYSIVSEKLAISRKDLLKIRYLMTLILSENYLEYKKIYNFFEDIETFMDYNIDSVLTGMNVNFRKIKIFAADIFLGTAGLIWMYVYAPVGVFASCLILSLSYLREHFKSFKAGVEWNLGLRSFALVALTISSFYWITNLDTTKLDLAKLSDKVEKIGVYKTDETVKIVSAKIDKSGMKEAVADILQSIKKKK